MIGRKPNRMLDGRVAFGSHLGNHHLLVVFECRFNSRGEFIHESSVSLEPIALLEG
jgi:hypothetical protein